MSLDLDAKDGRPVDPQVPGTIHDLDAAVAALLAQHDATRTDGKPPWPPSWAMYGTMWEERDKALAELNRLRDALETIADGRMCTAVVDNAPPSSWCRNDPGRSRDSRYEATRWCDACIARDALGYGR